MRELLPVFVVLSICLLLAFAAAVGIVVWSSGGFGQTVGTVLVYEVDSANDEVSHATMARLVEAVDRRVNPGWSRVADVRIVRERKIEIGVFGGDPRSADRIERLLARLGTLEFRIVANDRDHKPIIARAATQKGSSVLDDDGNVLAQWIPADPNAWDTLQSDPTLHRRPVRQGDGDGETTEVLVVSDAFDVTGDLIERATAGLDSTGRPCVEILLSERGGKQFSLLTGNNLPVPDPNDPTANLVRKLGIVLDGRLHSAPAIQATVYRRAQITGSFSVAEVQELVAVLNAGALPVPIRKVQRRRGGDE